MLSAELTRDVNIMFSCVATESTLNAQASESHLYDILSHVSHCDFPPFSPLFCCHLYCVFYLEQTHLYCRYLNTCHSVTTLNIQLMWLVWQKKTGRHLVFYYRGTVSTFFLFESVTQEMRDLHHATSHSSPHLSLSTLMSLKFKF